MGFFKKLFPTDKSSQRNLTQAKQPSKNIRHIVCLCYDAPYINSIKSEIQNFIIQAEQKRGSIVMPTSHITFESFYDNASLEKPDMIRQKLEQIYCQVYQQNAMYELADKAVPRETQQRDGHTLVKYFVLYEETDSSGNSAPVNLASPSTIKIIRDSSIVASVAPTIISINGRQVATIPSNGGSSVIRVDISPIVLETNAVGKGVRYELEVPSGAYGEIHVKANVFQPKLTVWK
ncbi:MAG: hypothetical protein VB119_08020 [Candidatus Metalachnospira sp.]|nr:hypothetical protein [Candidatus Metalachnospira sp.]